MFMAFAFGTQGTVAAFLVAFRLAHLLRRILGEGALQTAFIPHFEKLKHENARRAGVFFCDLSGSLTALLSILITLVMIALGVGLTLDVLSPSNQEVAWLTFLMMPSLLFICLFGLNASLLQCEKSFFTPSAAPIAFNLIWIFGIIYLKTMVATKAMSWLACFIVIACFCQWFLTIPKTLKILRSYGIENFRTNCTLYSRDVLSLVKPLMLGLVGVAASQINNAFDVLFARYASEEGPALLWYAIRLQQLPLALFGIAISGALLPPLSRAIKANDLSKFHLFLNFALCRSIAWMLPITVALFIMGDTCVTLIYGRGDFTQASIIGTTTCLWGYSFGLIPMTLVLILAPAFYAQDNYRTPSNAAVASMVLNIVLNALMIFFLGFGAASVAFATSISAWFNFAWLALALAKNFGSVLSYSTKISLGKVLAVSIAAAAAVVLSDVFFGDGNAALAMAKGQHPFFPDQIVPQMTLFLREALSFAAGFTIAVWFVKGYDLFDWIPQRRLKTQLAPLHRASTLPNLVSKTIKSESKVETLPRF
jgi:putative peptidoglycan lipid II flippase